MPWAGVVKEILGIPARRADHAVMILSDEIAALMRGVASIFAGEGRDGVDCPLRLGTRRAARCADYA
jgi:hypothetical protein